eukprot:TRINITY_DN31071_c0_g1_i3.p1 TRINITY_DN31071_c0_g1~~TRINITY_DN31071_c0_g1_i3.p1  ORF type:complete len:105 (+),score=15.23 TRINITY_DN31071_c0_g1_i3:76-390(+)
MATTPETTEVDRVDMSEGLGAARDRIAALEKHAQTLQTHFQSAQQNVAKIGSLCDEAEASVKRSQSQLNRAHREMHILTERTNSREGQANRAKDRSSKRSPDTH